MKNISLRSYSFVLYSPARHVSNLSGLTGRSSPGACLDSRYERRLESRLHYLLAYLFTPFILDSAGRLHERGMFMVSVGVFILGCLGVLSMLKGGHSDAMVYGEGASYDLKECTKTAFDPL